MTIYSTYRRLYVYVTGFDNTRLPRTISFGFNYLIHSISGMEGAACMQFATIM